MAHVGGLDRGACRAAAETRFSAKRMGAEHIDVMSELPKRTGLGPNVRVHATGAAQIVGSAHADAERADGPDVGHAPEWARERRSRSCKAGLKPRSTVAW